jgi:hypothetical protein
MLNPPLLQKVFLARFGTQSCRCGGTSAATNSDIPFATWGEHGNWRSTCARLRCMDFDEDHVLFVTRVIIPTFAGARQQRGGGGPGGECGRRPVGIPSPPPVVGAGNPVAYYAWHGRGLRGPTTRSAGSSTVGKAIFIGFLNRNFKDATGAKIPRPGRPICFFVARYHSIASYLGAGACIS